MWYGVNAALLNGNPYLDVRECKFGCIFEEFGELKQIPSILGEALPNTARL